MVISSHLWFKNQVDLSNQTNVEMNLRYEEGYLETDNNGEPLNFAGENIISGTAQQMNHEIDNSHYGTYMLLVSLTDKAGNFAYSEIPLRVNAPPMVETFNFDPYTSSGKPMTLSAIPEDPDDENQEFQYSWSLPGYEGIYPEFEATKNTATPNLKLRHKTPTSQESVYRVELIITDSDGKDSEVFETEITVRNTTKGDLYDNEYWNPDDVHRLVGTVNVGGQNEENGFTLTIAPGANIEIPHNFEGEQYKINVETYGTLLIEPGADITVYGTGYNLYWGGIYIEGTATIDNAAISKAEQGVTITSQSSVTLEGTTFDSNKTAIHVLKDGQEITNCMIQNSYYYGVKEEAEVTPVLSGCVFDDNFIDYYDKEKGALTDSELAGKQ